MIPLKSLTQSNFLHRLGLASAQMGLLILHFEWNAHLEGMDSNTFLVKLLETSPYFFSFDYWMSFGLAVIALLIGKKFGMRAFLLSQIWNISRITQSQALYGTPLDTLLQLGTVFFNFGIGYWLLHPTLNSRKEIERIAVRLICKIYRSSELVIGRVEQLSKGGLFLLTLAELDSDEKVIIKIAFHDQDLLLPARVVHRQRSFRTNGFGFEFESLDATNENAFKKIWSQLKQASPTQIAKKKSA